MSVRTVLAGAVAVVALAAPTLPANAAAPFGSTYNGPSATFTPSSIAKPAPVPVIIDTTPAGYLAPARVTFTAQQIAGPDTIPTVESHQTVYGGAVMFTTLVEPGATYEVTASDGGTLTIVNGNPV